MTKNMILEFDFDFVASASERVRNNWNNEFSKVNLDTQVGASATDSAEIVESVYDKVGGGVRREGEGLEARGEVLARERLEGGDHALPYSRVGKCPAWSAQERNCHP